MIRTTRGRGVAWTLGALLSALFATGVALAAQGDRVATQALIAELQSDADHRAAVADPVAHAQDALERAARMRSAGDEVRASEAEALARQWAETGRDVLRAVQAEARANDLRKKALETEAQVAKTREVVEEVIARTGRLRAQIEATERDGGSGQVAVELHDSERAAGKRTGAAQGRPSAVVDGGAP